MRLKVVGILLISIFLLPGKLYCWGFFGHKKINRLAVFTLPTELITFYKRNIEFITSHAVDADMRRYALPEEAARHYIDIDHYGSEPFAKVPRIWKDAIEKYTEDTLQAYGIVPWHVERMYNRLVDAYKKNDTKYILKTAADIGHYIADAHVPLHTTENYNGQLTGQHGIHGFWESRLPELFSEDYNYFTGKAVYIESPLDAVWNAVEVSHNAVDSVLSFEKGLSEEFPSDRKFAFEEKGRSTVKTYSKEYSADYHTMLDRMVERRMRASIAMIGSFWYSAWIDAGQPSLIEEVKPEEMEQLEQEQQQLEADYRTLKVKSREHEE